MYISPRRLELDLSCEPAIRFAGVYTHGEAQRTHTEQYRDLGTWSVHLYRYHADLRVDGEWYEIHPGRATLLPPDAELEYRFHGRSTHAFVHFSLVGSASAREISGKASIPLMQELGAPFGQLNAQIEQVISSHAARPRRAAVGLWDLLWRLSELHERPKEGAAGAIPTVVQMAMERIELALGGRVYVRDLAKEIGYSHAHLTRLFRAATGRTISAYIAQRRAEKAADLLMHTNVPIKTIAAQIGLPDLHQFNKTIRRLLGTSPRLFRRGS